MGSCCSETQPLMILTIILILFSLNSCVMSVVNDGDDSSSFLSLSHNAYPPESFDVYIPIEKVSGENENESEKANREGSNLLEGFRVLLGLKSIEIRRRRSKGGQNGHFLSPSLSPSPSPFSSEVESLSPSPSPSSLAPISHIHVKPQPERHGFHSLPRPQKVQGGEKAKAKAKRVLTAVLVSTGVAILLCVAFLILAWNKYKRHHKKPKRRISVMYGKSSRGRSNKYCGVSSQKKSSSSTTKVSLNPALDLFYLESLGKDLEQPQQQAQLPQACDTHSQNHTTHNDGESGREPSKPELDDASSSSAREITSVHEDLESLNNEYDCLTFPSGGKIVPIEECRSSDGDEEDDDGNESFHSFGESNSSNVARLSNASLGSFSDALENFNSNEANKSSSLSIPIMPSIPSQNQPSSDPSLESQCKAKHEKFEATNCSSIDQNNLKTPPPPPPPPPPPLPTLAPPRINFLASPRPPCSARIESKASTSSTLPNPPSPKEQNKTLQMSDLASSPSSVPKPPIPPGIPPPPCPPPPFRPNAPPPPPSQLPQTSPLGKDGSPLPKLKPLHWDKVRAAPDQSMVWDKIRSSSFELDEEMIESLFGYNLQNSMKNDEAKSKTPSPSKHILEPKRLQNITILSKALSVTSDQVCKAILQGNGLSLQQLEALVKMAPTKEEEAKLSGYEGDVSELGSAEKFVKAMLNVPFAFQRVEAMLYKETFDDEVVHLRNSFSMLQEACKELRSSRLFLKLLEAVLKTGNRMNVGTIRGGARAFKLDALLKLADVKGTDGKTSLLHFVVQEIVRSEGVRVSDSIMGRLALQKTRPRDRGGRTPEEEKEDDYRAMGLDLVSGLGAELFNVKKTAATDLDGLASSVSNLSHGAARLRGLLDKDEDGDGDGFASSMGAFLVYAERRLRELRAEEEEVMSHVKEVTEYFHGNVISKEEANPLRIFVIVRDFLGMLDHVCKELRSSKTPRSPNPLASFR